MRALACAHTLALAGLVLFGCGKKSERQPAPSKDAGVEAAAPAANPTAAQVIIDDLTIELAEGDDDYELYADQLAQHLGRQLTRSGYFFALPNDADPMKPAKRAKIAVAISYQRLPQGSTGEPSLLAAIEMTASWVGDRKPFLRENLLGERSLKDVAEGDMAGVVPAHVAKAAEEAARGLVAQERLRTGPDDRIELALTAGRASPSLVRFALGLLAERKLEGGVALAERHLASEHPEVRDAALAALVAIGDPAAVNALGSSAQFDDHDSMRVVIEAVGAIGGQEAIDYLEFVASGHPDDGIKKLAADALRRARERKSNAKD